MNITEGFLIEIGRKISELRDRNKQTLDDIEFLTGIDSSDINKYELGKINLTMKTLIKLSIALRVKPKDLLDFKFDLEKYNNEKS
ncbi:MULTISPECIES: helix-turn-helix domain-containing protein [unclassified Chryseobacterium]|uniref:helix-turn-helix domain-containing protein n=1 Tax=unclassified Chryseobacterium TaxID=2593645 RepID=UPI001AE76843|nr:MULTISPECIES: helix-turn-helix transcriptional regulator [unclassified Chryseobacterium]MBP1164577.1 transcriptional regulator with XRE-family HTH domain [Chryseobacterium sp. PvR013]